MLSGDEPHADIHGPVAQGDADAAVLGRHVLRDIHLGHDLDAARQGRLSKEMAGPRGEILYGLDRNLPTRFSHENSAVQMTYKEFLGKPNSKKAHKYLHTDIESWNLQITEDNHGEQMMIAGDAGGLLGRGDR